MLKWRKPLLVVLVGLIVTVSAVVYVQTSHKPEPDSDARKEILFNTAPRAIRWQGNLYCWWGEQVEDPDMVGPVLGQTMLATNTAHAPSENMETNIPVFEGLSFYQCGDGLAVFYNDAWQWLPPKI